MKDKLTILITGASSGIGRATALELAGMGHNLILVARRKHALEDLAEECRAFGSDVLTCPVDVTYEEDVQNTVNQTISRFGGIDVLVNNAAQSILGKFEDIPMQDFRRVIETNLFGYINFIRAVLPYFKTTGKGHVINLSSVVGRLGQPFSIPYTVSKFGIVGLTESLQQEYANEKGINFSLVLPGTIDTPLFNQAANYMGVAVKAPEPVLPASDVAKAIVRLIKSPKKQVVVGPLSKYAFAAKAIAPKYFDKKFRTSVLEGHFKQSEPEQRNSGNLYQPKEEYNQISGGWSNNGKGYLNKLPKTIALTGLALGGAIVAGVMTKNLKEKYFTVEK